MTARAATPRPTTRARASGPARAGSVHAARLRRLASALAAHDCDWVLVTNPLDVAYLTGFLGGDSYLLAGQRERVIISDFRYEEELVPVRALARVHIRREPMVRAVAGLLADRSIRRVAIQAETVTLASRDALAEAAGAGVTLVPVRDLVAPLRAVKDETEVRAIRAAARIQEQALLAVLPTIRPGQTELEVAARIEAEMKTRGSSAPGFETIVAARANGSLPHYRPHKVKLAANRPLLIDWGAVVDGYHSDMTRTFSLGRWPAPIREIYDVVLDAHRAAAAALAPGRTTREIDAIARGYISRHGYAERFGHGLGHGLGFNAHEEPFLSHIAAATTLREGMVVTIEPGIYLPGVGGVRLEDDYLITARGAENLCSLPLDAGWATL
ncbi:MAG: Xaa-Pro peptidase family protein [Planctomycetota bacterium]|nr:Xaa-Pro peptidase family protein [Planctomycetota bacterium]